MKIYDMHIHAHNKKAEPEKLLGHMAKAGVYGGCVFSTKPAENNPEVGISFEERMKEVLAWSEGYEGRIFPILWIHPYEENIFEKLRIAKEKGICGFKIMCSNYYIYEEQCIKVLEEIAKLDMPVIFHTGILWDGQVSSEYNRPVNWEALLRIKGLRFSMGHCSWPWVDECVALYGKFLNSRLKGDTAEMFFDITPGTPQIYREDLFNKLFNIGYDVGDNIMFGTDSNAEEYSESWPAEWLELDGEIMDKMGVSLKNREKIYHDNLMRFLGKSNVAVNPASPEEDNSHVWTAENPEVKEIIKKWYGILEFSKEFDAQFEKALAETKISDAISIEKFVETGDGKRNLLSFLFMCEILKKKYEEKGIPEEILIATLKDIVIWTNTWSDLKNELYLGECGWLSHHLSMKLFRLGRLQFCMGKAECDIPQAGVKKGENVIEVHIPEDGAFPPEECDKSFAAAKEFFAKYFPEFEYKCFTCHSWLLDETLGELLKPTSNILAFAGRFTPVHSEESDAILRYVFSWDMNRRKVLRAMPASSFAQKVRERAISGGKFYETLGMILK